MVDQPQRQGSASGPSTSLSHPPQQHALSCTHCRQRKVKCDKVHPCVPCQRSKLECVFPERVRHPKKKKGNGSKAASDELMLRLARMEELIEKMKAEGKVVNAGNPTLEDHGSASPRTQQSRRQMSDGSRSQGEGGSDAGDGTTRYIGSAIFRSLTSEVEGLKQTMDDISEGEDTPESGQTPSDTQTSNTSVLFGASPLPARDIRLIHPPAQHMVMLCDFYNKNCDPMFKLLHKPTLQVLVAKASYNPQEIPFGNYVEALLFSVYYAAVTSLSDEQCVQCFQDGKDHLLAKYKNGTETALVNADLLNTTELGVLQALVIFLSSRRANDDSQYVWTMTSIAIRIGHSLGLHRENSRSGLSPFQTEMRRRLWWQLIHLDVGCCEDRGSDPFILDRSFNTKKPLNINDSDLRPDMTTAPIERREFTEMSKTMGSHIAWNTAMKLGYIEPVKEGEESMPSKYSFEEREAMVIQLEKKLESNIIVHCNPANSLEWVTAVVMRLLMARLRLALYHPPMHDSRSTSHQFVSRETVLKAAVQNLEYTHLLDTEPGAAQWRWYFQTHVQWHALAATLTQLCVLDKGPLVDRAWIIINVVFDDWATRIADSKNGMLWRPIKKLMSKAQTRRNETMTATALSSSQQQMPLPQFDTFSPRQDPIIPNTSLPYHPDSVIGLSQSPGLDQTLSSNILSSLNVDEAGGTINWAEWDELMQDFEMVDPSTMDPNLIQQEDNNQLGSSWW